MEYSHGPDESWIIDGTTVQWDSGILHITLRCPQTWQAGKSPN